MSSSRGYGSGLGSSRSIPKKKVAVSYVIRDPEEKMNRSGVNALCLDGTNGLLYTAGRDSIIRSWDISQSDNMKECPHLKSFEHHTDWVNDIALCMDGRYFMSASSDITLKLWDTKKGTCSSTLRTHKDYVRCLAYAKGTEVVASAGLDKSIYLWDIKTLTSLTAVNNTINTTTLPGQKDSVYSMVMNDSGTVLVSGSTDKLLRVWDPRTFERQMKLKGHTDNVRTLALNRDGTMCLSGSSDGTVRLWSLGQQRCVETIRVHEGGVWALVVNPEFSIFYSGGRDKRVYGTELVAGAQEGTLLFSEDSPVLSLALDQSNSMDSLWVATTNTTVNKWCIDTTLVAEMANEMANEETLEEDLIVTDIDEPTPLFTRPVSTLPGRSSIKDFRVLNNRQQVLTRDCSNHIALWDVLQAKKIEDLGCVDLEDEAAKRQERFYIPNWFSVEVKTGMLTIRLEENECFSAWVTGSHTNVEGVATDLKMNLGALVLHALFENWPSTQPQPQEVKQVEKAHLAPSPPPPPQVEELMEMCAADLESWENLATALDLPSPVIERIKNTHENLLTNCLEDVFKMWLKEAEEVTWDMFIDSLSAIGQTALADKIKERLGQYHDQQKADRDDEKNDDQTVSSDKEKYIYFTVPGHTPVIIADSGDCGTTLMRFICKDAASNHETRQLNNCCPVWVMDIVCQKKLPSIIKTNFCLSKFSDTVKESKGCNDRLSAQDLLTIKKVQEYAYPKLFGDKDGKSEESLSEVDMADCIDIFCMDKVLDPELDLRTVKYTIWKSSGDMKLFYKERNQASVKLAQPVTQESNGSLKEEETESPENEDTV